MNQLFNYYKTAETPTLILRTPSKDKLYSLPLAYSIRAVYNFNAQSTLDFNYPKYSYNEPTGTPIEDVAYNYIKGKMVVSVDDKYFLINSCPETDDGATPIKTVSCLSLDAEFMNRRITLSDTTEYQLVPLLQIILGLLPSWSLGTVDDSLIDLYRSFSSTNNVTLYSFITGDMSSAYNAVFSFDTDTKTISAIQDTVPYPNTNISIGFNNLVKKIEYNEITEEITTALSIYGGSGLDIHFVNPLGTAQIFDFSYFKNSDWMSSGLIAALNSWEDKVTANKVTYTEQLTNLEVLDAEMTVLLADLSDLNAQLYSLQSIRDARIQQSLDTTDVDAQIATQEESISSKNIDIASKQSNIDSIRIQLRKIVHSLFFTSQISFINFNADTSYITTLLDSVSTNWTNVYNNDSTYPNFDADNLTAQTPTINNDIIDCQNKNTTLYNYLATGFPTYPPSSSILTTLTGYINAEINSLNTLYGLFNSIIPSTSVTILIDELITELTAYLQIIYYPSNMTDTQYLELSSYILENSYTNSNIIMTSSMTPSQVQIQAQGLYDCGKIILGRTSVPRYEFTGDIANFIALEEFKPFTDELDLGKVITIIRDDDTIINAVLLQMDITYDNPTNFSMTFGNSLRLDDPTFIYTDLLGPPTGGGGTQVTGIDPPPLGTIPSPSPITAPVLPPWTTPISTIPTSTFTSIQTTENKSYTWPVASPVAGGIPGPRLIKPQTVLRIDSYVVGGTSVTFNIERRPTIGTTGTNILASNVTTTSTGQSEVTFATSSLLANDWLWLNIVSVSGTVTQFVVTLTILQNGPIIPFGGGVGGGVTTVVVSGGAGAQGIQGEKGDKGDKGDTGASGTGTGDVNTSGSVTAGHIAVFYDTSGTLIEDGGADIPIKATGAEVDTGTDDAKFATPKAIKDSHNVPSVAPGTSGNVLTSNGTDWTSQPNAGGGIGEAPIDGTPYVRQDAAWIPMPASGAIFPGPTISYQTDWGVSDGPFSGPGGDHSAPMWIDFGDGAVAIVGESHSYLADGTKTLRLWMNDWTLLTTFHCNWSHLVGSIPSFSLCTNLTEFIADNNPLLAGIVPDFSACTLLTTFYVQCGGGLLIGYTPGSLATQANLSDINIGGQSWDDVAVNALLHDLVTSLSLGSRVIATVDLSAGSMAAPTGAGITDAAALVSAGWTVTTN